MKTTLYSVVVVAALAAGTLATQDRAAAEPFELNSAQMDAVTGGRLPEFDTSVGWSFSLELDNLTVNIRRTERTGSVIPGVKVISIDVVTGL
jgi:hypothetical protein